MPELPEVETIARTLQPQIQGCTIVATHLFNLGTLEGPIGLEAVAGRTVSGVGRRGKLLLVRFAPLADRQEEGVAFHLKMTGRIFVYEAGTQPGPHTRALFDLEDGRKFFFDDSRKFGYIRVLSPKSYTTWPFWQKLGPEPLELDQEAFVALFAGRRGHIKALLLNQSVLAGVGNIYADESLFRSGIAPDCPVQAITLPRLHRLHAAVQQVLLESIDACGSSIRDYRTARGDAGAFQNRFQVYGRANKRCFVCETPLVSVRVAGRGTVYCPHCQK